MTPAELRFSCPLDCLPGVGEVFSNQYALPSCCTISGVPTVLDIGANCGAFTIWARMAWPGCRVFAYEPQPDIFDYLKANLAGIPDCKAYNCAIGDPALQFLRPGQHSRLCSSQYQMGEQADSKTALIPIGVGDPVDLPKADIIKIDTEGAEGYSIERLAFTPAALMVEWHGADNRRRVELALADKMKLAATRTVATDRGIYCYIKA